MNRIVPFLLLNNLPVFVLLLLLLRNHHHIDHDHDHDSTTKSSTRTVVTAFDIPNTHRRRCSRPPQAYGRRRRWLSSRGMAMDTNHQPDDDDGDHHHHQQRQQQRQVAMEWWYRFQDLLALSTTASQASPDQMRRAIRHVFYDPSTNNDHVPSLWRDMLAASWNIVTLEGTSSIQHFLTTSISEPCSSPWTLEDTPEIVTPKKKKNGDTVNVATTTTTTTTPLEVWYRFRTTVGTGRAHVRLTPVRRNDDDDDDDTTIIIYRATTLLTTLQSLHKCPWQVAPLGRPVVTGTGGPFQNNNSHHHHPAHGTAIPNRVYWHDQKVQHQQMQRQNPYVLLIGGGQAGLSLAARLQHLQIPYLVVEMGPTVGTSWRQHRYPSLSLHDPVYYNHMPYIEFPPTWPLFTPRDKLANFMECYVTLLDLHVVCRTRVVRAVPDPVTQQWTVHLEPPRVPPANDHENDDEQVTITASTVTCQHIVFCTGNSSHPRRPGAPSLSNFWGRHLHSSQYRGGAAFRHDPIRHVIVVGSNNSALDICQDLWEQLSRTNGGPVETITLIQRTPGMVVSTESVLRYGLGPLYAEDAALHHEEADLVATTVPYKVALATKWKEVTRLMEENDAQMLDGLRRAGYRLDRGPDGTGIFAKSATEGGGFYIDHGCAELIIRQEINVRFATVTEYQSDRVVIRHLDDPARTEETLPADLIVFATGFDTMDRYVQEICGTDIANRVGRTWGLGLGHSKKDPGPWEGELRNMWKPTNVDGLWFQGGNLAQNRHYSKYLALQLAARYVGIKPNVYGIPKPTPPANT